MIESKFGFLYASYILSYYAYTSTNSSEAKMSFEEYTTTTTTSATTTTSKPTTTTTTSAITTTSKPTTTTTTSATTTTSKPTTTTTTSAATSTSKLTAITTAATTTLKTTTTTTTSATTTAATTTEPTATTTAITSKVTNDKRYIGTWSAYAYSDYENAPKKDLSNESVSFTLYDDMTGIMFNFGGERKAELTWANESNDCITVNWKGDMASFNYSNDELVFKRINGKIYYFVKEYSLGDVNDDNYINAVDASIVLTYYAMVSTNKTGNFTATQKKAADVNHDGLINAVDASCILSYYAYISTTKEEIKSLEDFLKK